MELWLVTTAYMEVEVEALNYDHAHIIFESDFPEEEIIEIEHIGSAPIKSAVCK